MRNCGNFHQALFDSAKDALVAESNAIGRTVDLIETQIGRARRSH